MPRQNLPPGQRPTSTPCVSHFDWIQKRKQVMIIDEVFATGDAHFVEKSSQRILQLVEQSQIVIIVSHNLDQIKNLCNRVIVMDKGAILKDGLPEETLDFYNRQVVHAMS